MIIALDSATPPTQAQAQAAAAAGIGLWNGYLATKLNVGLLRPWTQAEFDAARIGSSLPVGYCSGWDDPAAIGQLAAAWRVRPCLDVETGIRSDGPWVQGWLDASGAGLYGNLGVHYGRRAPFHVLSWYVSDPAATWGGSANPGTPCGWQWWNSHDEFGVSVDRCWFDDWFLGEDMDPQLAADLRTFLDSALQANPGDLREWWAQTSGDVAALKAADAAHQAQLDRLEAVLHALQQGQSPKPLTGTASVTVDLKQA